MQSAKPTYLVDLALQFYYSTTFKQKMVSIETPTKSL